MKPLDDWKIQKKLNECRKVVGSNLFPLDFSSFPPFYMSAWLNIKQLGIGFLISAKVR